MKFVRLFAGIFLVFVISHNVLGLDTVSSKYFPLKIGNIWVYERHNSYPPSSAIIRTAITHDSIINSKKYYYWQNAPFNHTWIRIDSESVNLYNYGTGCPHNPNEALLDSLSSSRYDTVPTCHYFLGNRVCADTGLFTIFNYQTFQKTFQGTALFASSRYYARNIGIYYAIYGEISSTWYILKGCVINGIVYGDTSLTGMEKISHEVPRRFHLSQNYPNPFNSVTTIRFDIPQTSPLLGGVPAGRGGFVKLVIFDALGREIVTLVNEELSPGTYEVEWPAPSGDATNYPSGVYYYKFTSGDYSETKKMILLK